MTVAALTRRAPSNLRACHAQKAAWMVMTACRRSCSSGLRSCTPPTVASRWDSATSSGSSSSPCQATPEATALRAAAWAAASPERSTSSSRRASSAACLLSRSLSAAAAASARALAEAAAASAAACSRLCGCCCRDAANSSLRELRPAAAAATAEEPLVRADVAADSSSVVPDRRSRGMAAMEAAMESRDAAVLCGDVTCGVAPPPGVLAALPAREVTREMLAETPPAAARSRVAPSPVDSAWPAPCAQARKPELATLVTLAVLRGVSGGVEPPAGVMPPA